MDRHSLNLYLDGYLALSDHGDRDRSLLIEEAAKAQNHDELLRDWLWLKGAGLDRLLELKIWFGLNYQAIGEILGMSMKEVGQTLRKQRSQRLPAYPGSTELSEAGGLSCFMVEQQMSPWVDGELQDVPTLRSLKEHLQSCTGCSQRLQVYRDLQTEVLKKRFRSDSISADEWGDSIRDYQRRFRSFQLKTVFILLGLFMFFGSIWWILNQKPEKMPNIYEITEEPQPPKDHVE